MLNKIIRFSLQNRILVLVASALLLVGDTYTVMHTEVDVFPDLNVPTIVIMTEANGIAAEEVEQLVTFPMETVVNDATGVRRVCSFSTNGLSVIWVEFDWEMDVYLVRQTVSGKLAVVSESLLSNVGKPTLGPQSSISSEMLIVGLTVDSTSMLDLRTIVDWTIRPRLLSIGGVAQVAVLGGDTKEYRIQLGPERMRHYGVTLTGVVNVTCEMNLNADGGVLYEYGNEYIVHGVISTDRVGQLAKAAVKLQGGDTSSVSLTLAPDVPVLLEDTTDVHIGAKPPKLDTASERGKPAVLLTVTKQPATSTLELTDKLETSLKDLQKNLSSDAEVSTDTFRQGRFIESSIDNVRKSLFEGGIFAVVVLFLFLANVRTTVTSLATLPLSPIASLLALYYMGSTINAMSLGGTAIAIGSLVDDTIVDVENVYKQLRGSRMGPQEERRPILGVVFNIPKEVRMSIPNPTLIVVVSFAPLFSLSGMEGKMLVPLGIAFIVALAASTVATLTVTLVLCPYLLGKEKIKDGKHFTGDSPVVHKTKEWYDVALTFVLGHKKNVLGGTIGLLVIALACFFTLGRPFLPPFNEGSSMINISSLLGISLEESGKIGHRAEGLPLTIFEIQTIAHKTGRVELDEHALGVNVSEIEASSELKDRSRSELVAEVREKLSMIVGANVEIDQPISYRIDTMPSGTKANITIKLLGDDLNRMFSLGNEIKSSIQDITGIADLNIEQQTERPQLIISPKREVFARYDISLPEFSEFADVCLAGKLVFQVHEKGKSFGLTVHVKDDLRDEMEKIHNLMIDIGNGQKISLNYIADIRSATGPNTISRENVKRKTMISANVADRDLRSAANDIQKCIGKQIKLPEGYHIEYGGQLESEQTASRILALTPFMSVVVIFLLLYREFRSVKGSVIILINLPLVLIGGVFALLTTTGGINIPAIIGFISLFDIATRNGMLPINHYNHLQKEEGYGVYDGVIRGLLDRLNPIPMTALSSALVLIPLAFSDDLPSNEIQSPMAKVILGGLLTSTFLNGFIIPIVYLTMYGKKKVTNEQMT